MSKLEQNTAALNEVLAMVNALPDAGSGGGDTETFPQKIYETDFILEETITSGTQTVCTISTGMSDKTYLNNVEILFAVFTCIPTDTSYAYHDKTIQHIGVYQNSFYTSTPMISVTNTDGTSDLYDKYVTSEGMQLTKISSDLSSFTITGKKGSGYPVAGNYHLELYRTGVTY